MAKPKEVIEVKADVVSTLGDKSKLNILAKGFPYSQFMDKELMTPTCLKQLRGDEDSLLDKF